MDMATSQNYVTFGEYTYHHLTDNSLDTFRKLFGQNSERILQLSGMNINNDALYLLARGMNNMLLWSYGIANLPFTLSGILKRNEHDERETASGFVFYRGANLLVQALPPFGQNEVTLLVESVRAFYPALSTNFETLYHPICFTDMASPNNHLQFILPIYEIGNSSPK